MGRVEADTEYEDWQGTVPSAIREDVLWKLTAYRRALFLADLAWADAGILLRQPRGRTLADQLLRSVGSISANVAEGYGRSSDRDRTRFYEFALGSAREARDWYYKLRHAFDGPLVASRIDLTALVIRLLLGLISAQRAHFLKEEPGVYVTADDG